jgi:aspartate aminotransferase
MFEEGIQLKKQYGADKVFDFSLGNPDIYPPEAFQNIFKKLATEANNENQKTITGNPHGYMPNAGFPFVREALAKKVNREQNVNIDSSHIIMSQGAAGGLNAIFKTILNSGDEVIVTKPFFMEYRPYTANYGAKLVEVDALENFDLDINAIGRALNEKTAAIIINSPNNPTGKIYPAALLDSLALLLKEHGKKTGRLPYLVSDEPYREIAYNCEVPPILSCYSESIVVTSYSKSLSIPGERIGFIAVSPDISGKDELIIGLIYSTRILGFVNAPALMQRIVASLTEVTVDISIYLKRREAFLNVLDNAGIEYVMPEGAFYFFCKVPPRKNGKYDKESCDKAFTEHLKNYLILGVPGSGVGLPGWLRFAYCVDEKIIKASGDAFKTAMENW